MVSRSLSFISWLMIASLLFAGCGPVGPSGNAPADAGAAADSEGEAAQSCPPLNNDRKVSVASTADSIEVFADLRSEDETNGIAWCDVSLLAINPVNLSSLPQCPYNSCLAAVDVDPDNVKVIGGTKPVLRYDLEAHKSKKDPESCGKSYCYAYYQLRTSSNSWFLVGYAKPYQAGGWYTEGGINHFSVFALVELPDPTPIAVGTFLSMYIASEFISDEDSGLSVSVILNGNAGQFDPQGEQRILRFQSVDPIMQENTPTECKAASSIESVFTCIFPYGAAVEFEYQDNGQAMLRNLDSGFEQVFYTSNVELY